MSGKFRGRDVRTASLGGCCTRVDACPAAVLRTGGREDVGVDGKRVLLVDGKRLFLLPLVDGERWGFLYNVLHPASYYIILLFFFYITCFIRRTSPACTSPECNHGTAVAARGESQTPATVAAACACRAAARASTPTVESRKRSGKAGEARNPSTVHRV